VAIVGTAEPARPCSPYRGGEGRRLSGGGRTVIRVVVVSLC